MPKQLFMGMACCAAIAAGWMLTPSPDHSPSPAMRWMVLADVDGDGRISGAEYDRISDQKTPMKVIDVSKDGFIELAELEGFFRGVDPIDLVERN